MSSIALIENAQACRRYDLSHLSDGEVLAGTRRLVGASNQLFADLLAHLAEVEARGIHRAKACASLYTYCVYELQFSEDAAFRRASAARFVKAFPALFDAVASGELHLTGLLMLGPHLTASNHQDVLARAKHRTKKELTKLVRELDPLPDVPARIAPLGPAPTPRSPLRNPTWAEYVASMVPVRHLRPGERPRDWVDESTIANAFEQSDGAAHQSDNATHQSDNVTHQSDNVTHQSDNVTHQSDNVTHQSDNVTHQSDNATHQSDGAFVNVAAFAEGASGGASRAETAHAGESADSADSANRAAGAESERIVGRQRYSVQFTASQEYADLVDRAKALLSHTGGTSLEEIHLRALHCLVTQLEKRKYGAPRPEKESARTRDEPARMGTDPQAEQFFPETVEVSAAGGPAAPPAAELPERSRHIPMRIRRRVFERDRGQCTFVDESGCRCCETARLQLHHLKPFALAGQHHADNLTLRCQAHNTLAAEQEFGRELVGQKREATRHESLRSQRNPRNG